MKKALSRVSDFINVSIITLTIVIFGLIAATNFLKLGRPGYNTTTLMVYAIGAGVGFLLTIGLLMLESAKIFAKNSSAGKITKLGHVAENPIIKWMTNPFWRIGIILLYTGLIVFSSFSGIQVWPQPDTYSNAQSFAVEGSDLPLASTEHGIYTTIWDVGVVPAFTEDMAAWFINIGYAMVGLLVVLTLFWITKFKIFDLRKLNVFASWALILMLVMAIPAAITFSKAHEIVAGENQEFYVAAFSFQVLNLWVFSLSGGFVPLAHIVHNSIFALGFTQAFSIGL